MKRSVTCGLCTAATSANAAHKFSALPSCSLRRKVQAACIRAAAFFLGHTHGKLRNVFAAIVLNKHRKDSTSRQRILNFFTFDSAAGRILNSKNVFGRQNHEHLAQKVFRISSGVDRNFDSRWADRCFHGGCSGARGATREAPSPSPSSPQTASSPLNLFV